MRNIVLLHPTEGLASGVQHLQEHGLGEMGTFGGEFHQIFTPDQFTGVKDDIVHFLGFINGGDGRMGNQGAGTHHAAEIAAGFGIAGKFRTETLKGDFPPDGALHGLVDQGALRAAQQGAQIVVTKGILLAPGIRGAGGGILRGSTSIFLRQPLGDEHEDLVQGHAIFQSHRLHVRKLFPQACPRRFSSDGKNG